jgi:hypothetical protein
MKVLIATVGFVLGGVGTLVTTRDAKPVAARYAAMTYVVRGPAGQAQRVHVAGPLDDGDVGVLTVNVGKAKVQIKLVDVKVFDGLTPEFEKEVLYGHDLDAYPRRSP